MVVAQATQQSQRSQKYLVRPEEAGVALEVELAPWRASLAQGIARWEKVPSEAQPSSDSGSPECVFHDFVAGGISHRDFG